MVDRALATRSTLLGDAGLDAVRVFNGSSDGIDGLAIEKLGEVCIVQLHEEKLTWDEGRVRSLAEAFHSRLGTRAVYRKVFVRDRGHVPEHVSTLHRDRQPWIGEPVDEEIPVRENGLRLMIRPYDGFSVGLFLEHRDNRRRVRELAAGRRVLNLFSYTGGFSVVAAAGGAVSAASVDLSRRCLEWSKRNFAANRIDAGGHRFFRSEAFDFHRRARRQGHRYDLIILDPPTFSRVPHAKKVFRLAVDLEPLVAGAVDLLEPGGIILLAANDREIPLARLEESLHKARPERRCAIVERPALPVDFAGDPDYSKTVIARFE
ncbi:MAG TPA: class I SAM-dependent methyltransferase [Phycisphaerae bacterium]|nr:class I SAM-dependent methyltransferase [Phycisphaerae bacterium]